MIVAIILLILASVFFSLFEQSLINVRKPRLYTEADDAEKHNRRHRAAKLRRVARAAEQSGKYGMTARIWTAALRTCAAILTGFNIDHGTAARTDFLSAALLVRATLPFLAGIFLAGLTPRFIARRAPERIAAVLLPLFELCILPLRPLYFLAQTAARQLRMVFPAQAEQPGMTEDELRNALIEGEKSGIVESKERTMVEGVFYLGDRPLGTFMTHRSEIQWLDIHATPEDIRVKALEYRDQRCFPVADSTLDAILGAAYLEDMLLNFAAETPAGLQAVMHKALFVPETMPALKAFEAFKRGKADYLFVMDEYGGFAGMVCVHDLMEEIVGELAAPVGEDEQAVQQDDGSWISGGGLNIDDAVNLFSLPGLAAAATGDYHTLAGFVLSLAGELPHTGDSFLFQGYLFTVLEMDGNRIDKIGIRKESLLRLHP